MNLLVHTSHSLVELLFLVESLLEDTLSVQAHHVLRSDTVSHFNATSRNERLNAQLSSAFGIQLLLAVHYDLFLGRLQLDLQLLQLVSEPL